MAGFSPTLTADELKRLEALDETPDNTCYLTFSPMFELDRWKPIDMIYFQPRVDIATVIKEESLKDYLHMLRKKRTDFSFIAVKHPTVEGRFLIKGVQD